MIINRSQKSKECSIDYQLLVDISNPALTLMSACMIGTIERALMHELQRFQKKADGSYLTMSALAKSKKNMQSI